MAVENQTPASSAMSPSRRYLVGTNVLVMAILAVGVVAAAQVFAFWKPVRVDMTSSGVNSLSEGTAKLLSGLNDKVRLTSLYFETDREEADQARYRQAARNLIDLYESTNRSKVSADWANPLKDHEKYQALLTRLREKSTFKPDGDAYLQHIDKYRNEIDGGIRKLLQDETQRVATALGTMGAGPKDSPLAQIDDGIRRLESAAQSTREQVDALMTTASVQYTAAISEIRSIYSALSKTLKDIGKFGSGEVLRNPAMPAAQKAYLQEANSRFQDLVTKLEGETTALQTLKPLKVDDLINQLKPTSNAIVVETDADARVIDFASTWPPVDEKMAGERIPFERRGFKGEEKLTSAILRATHKQQTAVVFVRFGGQPLFMGGFMPGQPPAMYAALKQQLEEANFIVDEWDLKTKTTLPDIDPQPTKTIFVVFKPEPPARNPMGQPNPQDQPFGETHRKALLDQLASGGRAIFVAGWAPGPMGPIPSTYEYSEYLKNTWGIIVDTSALLIETMNIEPGKYRVGRQDFHFMVDLESTDHPIVKDPLIRSLTLPSSCPLNLASPAPEEVKLDRLIYMPKRDGIWGVKQLQAYQAQLSEHEYLTKIDTDLEPPFDLAVAATKGDSKIVVVSSRTFAEDDVAFAREIVFAAQGLAMRSRNPGNLTLFVNSLHWLNDDEAAMGLGRPIEAAVLRIPSKSTVTVVQAATIFGWPALALVAGACAWWVRRR
ncbi:MAG: Gldg family protein [Planctomycetes bacterium]|nr:Gldg family protein [Planctomycetota bacterium]MBI3834179.1 Gldg family protein [Planctomycetota bacterium]